MIIIAHIKIKNQKIFETQINPSANLKAATKPYFQTHARTHTGQVSVVLPQPFMTLNTIDHD